MPAALLLLIVTLSEASIGIFVKLVDGQIPILTLSFYRVFFAAMFLFIAVRCFNKKALRFPNNNLKDITIVGFLIATQITLFNVALSMVPVANAVIFWSIAPFFVFIFSSLFLKEKPRPAYFLIFVIAIVGIVLAEPASLNLYGWGTEDLGNMIALLTGVVYAGVVTYLRSEGIDEEHIDIFWFMVAASVYLLPMLIWFGPGAVFATSTTTLLGVSVPVLVWVLGLGVVSTGLAYFCISYVLQKLDANIYSLVDIIVSPVMAAILAYLVFVEIPSSQRIFGGVILLCSGALLTYLRQLQHKKVPTKKPVHPSSARM